MFGSILHRMIFRELVRVFLLCLLGITGILLLAGIVAEASQQGLNPGQILAVIPLLIPSTLPYTIPATTLFATCIVYGRLAADNEILAIRASGINMTKVVWPGVVLGLMTSGATLGMYYHVIPYTHHLMRTMFLGDVEELLYAMLRRQNQISAPHLDYAIYVKSVQGRRLVSPIFKRRGPNGLIDLAASAREAELRVDMHNDLILVHMRNGDVLSQDGATVSFDDRIFDVPIPDSLKLTGYRRPRDMTWAQLLEQDRILLDTQDELAEYIAKGERDIGSATPTDEQKENMKKWHNQQKETRTQIYTIIAEKQMRPALSLGCLFFVLVGCPMGIWFSRSDYLSAFITCFLPIVFIYYPLILCGTGMVKDGRMPSIAVWSADILMSLIGGVLFYRLLKN